MMVDDGVVLMVRNGSQWLVMIHCVECCLTRKRFTLVNTDDYLGLE